MKKVLFTVVLFFSVLGGFAGEVKETEEEMVDNSVVIDRITNSDIEVTLPSLIFTFKEVDVKLRFINPGHTKLLLNKGSIEFIINGEIKVLEFVDGQASFKHKFDSNKNLTIFTEDFSYDTTVTAYPLWAILTPFGFILLWLVLRKFRK